MRRARLGVTVLLLALGAGCGGQGAGTDDAVAVAAGSAVDPVPLPTTSVPVAATAPSPAPSPPTPPAPPTTRRPATTTTAAPRVTTAGPRPAQSGRPYAPPPPEPGVAPWGVSGYGGEATVTAHDTTVVLRVYPREQYAGEMFQIGVEVTTTEAVRSVKVDMGNGTVVDLAARGWTCSREPRRVSAGAPHYRYPTPGDYRIRALVTVVPCNVPIAGPPELPPAAPSPFEKDVVVVEAGMAVEQRPDRPPPPVGPPPGA